MRFASLSPDEVQDGRTDPVRTVLDCARTLPFDEALAVCDSALRAGAVDRPSLLAAAKAGPRTGRPAALRVVDAADARAANPFESVLRAIALEVPGLGVVAQGQVGQVVRFVWEDVMRKPAYVRGVLVDLVRLRQEEAVRSCAG